MIGTREEKTGVGWKERKEGVECAMKRERQSTHVEWKRNKREGEKGTGRSYGMKTEGR
jgi:hypothetical protein